MEYQIMAASLNKQVQNHCLLGAKSAFQKTREIINKRKIFTRQPQALFVTHKAKITKKMQRLFVNWLF
jgi:hypothetical protein